MNSRLLSLLGLCLALGLHARAQAPDDSAPAQRSPDELNELLGPIALYPDPLISLILPASTVPSDLVLADRFVGGGGDPAAADDKPWDASVKALTHYPDTLKWLDDNLDWTSQVGDAFVSQPVDVMEAIQALRAKAKSLGNLVDTPQESVVQDAGDIRIVPAQPDALYAPSYDPGVVYDQQAAAQPFVSFSPPYIVGPWLGYDFDWHHHHLYWGRWHHGWDYGHDRGGEVAINNSITNSRVWHVDPKRRLLEVRHHADQHVVAGHARLVIPHPKPLAVVAGKGESIRRPEVINGGRPGTKAVLRETEEIKRAEKGKGRVLTPKTVAPGIAGEIKPKGQPLKPRAEELKPKGEPKHMEEKRKTEVRHAEELKPKGEPKRIEEKRKTEVKHAEELKPKGEPKRIEEKRKTEVKHAEEPKPKGEPKRIEEKRKTEVKHTEELKPKGEPKHMEEKRKTEVKHTEEKRKPEPKPKAEPRKEAPKTSSKDGKKKDKKDQ